MDGYVRKNRRQQFHAGHHHRLARDHASRRHLLSRDAEFRGDITGADVFGERAFYEGRQQDCPPYLTPSSAARLFSSCAWYSARFERSDSITCAGALCRNLSLLSCRSLSATSFSYC